MEKPITRSPQFWAFSSHILSQSPQNLQVNSWLTVCPGGTNSRCTIPRTSKKNNEPHFHIWPHLSSFFRSRWSGRLPLARSLYGLMVVPIAPTFVARDDLRKKVWVTFNLIFQLLARSQTSVIWSFVSRRGTNVAATRLMFKSTVKIRWQELQFTPVASEISSVVYRRSSLICSRIVSTFSSVRLVEGRPEWGWSSTLISPLLNRANHSKTCVRLSASSLKAFWNIACASVAVFPETETKSQADSLFGTVRHHDFARGAWQHLGELTTQARTTFYVDVRLATDWWRVQLHSPIGGTLNYN